MQMISFIFFALVAVTFALLYFCNKLFRNKAKSILISKIILLVTSYVFITYADYRFSLIIIGLTLTTWLCTKYGRFAPLGVIIAVASLGVFKYTDFFIESFVKIFGGNYSSLKIILPLGISFYTFSAISYIVDVKRKETKSRNLLDVALYLSFFPKLTSGPIQRSEDFFTQIDSERKIGFCSFNPGIQIFVFGLFKKIVIADRLSVFVNQIYDTPKAFGSLTVIGAMIAYSLQIYFDFSGYSDMAIGTAKILGFDLPRNFNLPYLAHNVTELWKRWHITLSSWLQKYLYISLGGNRKGKIRTYINLILTMVIGGLWHGANLTYIVWGALHGVALAVHKLWMTLTKSPEKKHSAFSNVISIAVTFIFTTLCWVFFRAETMSDALIILKQAFSFRSGVEQPYFWLFVAIGVLVIGTLCAIIKSRNAKETKKKNVSYVNGYYPIFDLTTFRGLLLFFLLCGIIVCFAYTGGSPFIYGNY